MKKLSLSLLILSTCLVFNLAFADVTDHIHQQEQSHAIPKGLLKAIAVVESKLSPYVINTRGRAYYFTSQERATAFAKNMLSKGVHDLNLGCMQIYWPAHKKKFNNNPAKALELSVNVSYAANLLKSLYLSHGSWEKAVQCYHSSVEAYGKPYQAKVYSIWENTKEGPHKIHTRNPKNRVFFSLSGNIQKKNDSPSVKETSTKRDNVNLVGKFSGR